MSVPSLVHLSVCSVSSGIIEGNLPRAEFQLNPDLSNKVFYEISKDFETRLTRKLLYEICSRLNITKVDMRHLILRRADLFVLATQKLESLTLGCLISLNTKNLEESKGLIKIEALLKRLLNLESQNQLSYLNMSGFEEKFVDGWAEPVSKMLPSLKGLILSERTLPGPEFQILCNSFSNLCSLDISNTNLTTLNGISNLSNLESIVIGGLVFQQSAELIELFQLKKLRVLDLSCKECFSCESKLFEQYMECELVLPELRFIDCSGTVHTRIMVFELIRTHPTIEKMAIIDSHTYAFNIPDIDLLTTFSLLDTIKSLKHYISLKNFTTTCAILKLSINFLKITYSSELTEELREWFFAVCSAIYEFSNGETVLNIASKCLKQLTRDTRIEMLSIPERQDLVNLLFSICDFHSSWAKDKEQNETLVNVFECFENIRFLSTPNLNLKRIYENSMEYVLMGEDYELQSSCLYVMEKALGKMEQEQKSTVLEDVDHCRSLVQLLNSSYRKNQLEMYKQVMDIVKKIIKYHPRVFISIGGVTVLIRHLKKFSFVHTLEIIWVLDQHQCHRKELYKSENFQGLLKYLKACSNHLEDPSEVYMHNWKTYRISSILAVLLFDVDQKNYCLPYLKVVDNLLKDVFNKLGSPPVPTKTTPSVIVLMKNVLQSSSFDGPILWVLYTMMTAETSIQREFLISDDFRGQFPRLKLHSSSDVRKMAEETWEVIRIF